jgi:hypothetical protein
VYINEVSGHCVGLRVQVFDVFLCTVVCGSKNVCAPAPPPHLVHVYFDHSKLELILRNDDARTQT